MVTVVIVTVPREGHGHRLAFLVTPKYLGGDMLLVDQMTWR